MDEVLSSRSKFASETDENEVCRKCPLGFSILLNNFSVTILIVGLIYFKTICGKYFDFESFGVFLSYLIYLFTPAILVTS